MQATDQLAFATLITKAWGFYGKRPTGDDVANWFDLLDEYPLDVVSMAFKRHVTDPQAGQQPTNPGNKGRATLAIRLNSLGRLDQGALR